MPPVSPSRPCASPAPSRTSCARPRQPASPAWRCSSTTSSCRRGRHAGWLRRLPASACRSRPTSRSTSRRFRPTCSAPAFATPSGSSTCCQSSARASWCAARREPRAGLDDDDLTAEQLHSIAGRAELRGLRLAYEAVPWGRVRTHEDAWRIVQRVDHPALGLCLDSFHVLSLGNDPSVIAQVAGDEGVPRPARRCTAPEHGCPRVEPPLPDVPRPGLARRGRLPQRRSWPSATPARWRSRCSTTSTSRKIPGTLPPTRCAPCSRSQRRSARAACWRLARARSSRRPATGSALGGFAFAELAVDEVSAPLVSRALAALGFAHVGQHRSMPVQLWEQGGARVLLNLAPQRSIAPATASICCARRRELRPDGVDATGGPAAGTEASATSAARRDRPEFRGHARWHGAVLLRLRAPA